MYIDDARFLSSSYDETELEVWSTEFDRCIQSAESQMMGLYPLDSGPTITKKQSSDTNLPSQMKTETSWKKGKWILETDALPL